MHKDFLNIHGPEHHFLDGASFLVAYKNAGGEVDVSQAIDMLAERTLKMPGAMCGFWVSMDLLQQLVQFFPLFTKQVH